MLNLMFVVLNTGLAGYLMGEKNYGFLLFLNVMAVIFNTASVAEKLLG